MSLIGLGDMVLAPERLPLCPQTPTMAIRRVTIKSAASRRFCAVIYVNGLNGAGGGYLLPPLTPAVVSALARGEQLDAEERRELAARYQATAESHLGIVDADPTDLGQAGWGVVFAEGADPAVREALGPLLEHRRRQAAAEQERRYRDFGGTDGYRPGESVAEFLVRHRVTPGQPANPDRMPYYLLLVGDPNAIPFRFQYMLDVVYAVGRLDFDRPEEYESYAHSVVANERRAGRPRAAFFGVRNPDDRATRLSADHLVVPLAADAAGRLPPGSVQTTLGEQATKARLHGILGGADTPDLIFVAAHGMGFPNGHPRQLPHQGALLCQDWPGPLRWRGPIPETFYFAAHDLGGEVRLSGLIAFLFACFGAGTPRTDDFAQQALGGPAAIAPHAFVGRLPKRLLGHPCGGALAVIGHVERAWGFSFMWPGVGEQVDAYREVVRRLLAGAPVGWAVEALNERFAALSVQLEMEKEDVAYGKVPDELMLSSLWTARNDARNSIVLGDPAARFRLPAECTRSGASI
jgi:hypothetical protein